MRYISHTGFNFPREISSTDESVRVASLPDVEHHNNTWFSSGNLMNEKIKSLMRLASIAYCTDGMVRQTVDRYSEMFSGISFDGKDRQVSYLKSRFNTMSLIMNQSFQDFMHSLILEYIKTGNVMLAKYRGYNKQTSQRVLYTNRPTSLSGLKLVSAEQFEPHFNKEQSFDGWILGAWRTGEFLKLNGPKAYRHKDGLLELPEPESENVLLPGADIIHLSYKKGPNSIWGNGMILAGLEDVSLLRGIETNTGVMIRKFSSPLYHHKITQAPVMGGQQNAIQNAYAMYQNMSPDGIIITGANHEISAVGSESQALRVEGYLDYFAKRAAIGIGSSPILIGLDHGAAGDGDMAWKVLANKVKDIQQSFSNQFETYIINEILYEGGFDPYLNEEDQVRLSFADVDPEASRKSESHTADLFSKDAIDLDEVGHRIKTNKNTDTDRLYSTAIKKQVTDDDADAKVKVVKAKPTANSRESIKDQVENLIVDDSITVENFIYRMYRRYGYSLEKLESIQDSLELLHNDKDAFIELVVQSMLE